MNESVNPPLQALPDGEAELRLVLRLQWEDVAALGQEAGRLAAQMQRPVTLDEAASHRLRTRSASHARPAPERTQQGVPSSVSSLTSRTPGEHARQAIEKINGTVGPGPGPTQTSA
ncbi:hypothetical protein [Streptomyces sp. NBC_01794]|uniref:hypothetical protein n=1 Tax=Streptomyces sp. NBC_01794 TaxID=2975942 RepID=UPI00308DB201|nr:hypothetical protein OIE54_38735 [Streptomyces sp. NBC_01794]